MRLVKRSDVRVEEIDGEAIVLDRSGSVVHHASGDSALVLRLVGEGIDGANVPADLLPAVDELVRAGVLTISEWSRRRMLKAVGGGLAGAGLITVALASPAAAASGSVTGVALVKTVNNNENVPLGQICVVGGVGNSGRGTCTFTRTEGPALISVTVTLSTGTSAVGREVYILQSNATNGCVGGTASPVAVWGANPALGPQTFSAPIAGSATRFVIALQLSGGGGVDGWSSSPVTLA